MSWKVYIVECSDGSLYTGITTDLERRVNEHNGSKIGARYTRAKQPVSLKCALDADNRSEATKLELSIKKMTRRQKLRFINTASKCS